MSIVRTLTRSTHSRFPIFRHPSGETRSSPYRPVLHKTIPSMAISNDERVYQPFLLDPVPGAEVTAKGERAIEHDWTADCDLETAKRTAETLLGERRIKVLVLYGSLRERLATSTSPPRSACLDPG